MPRSRTWPSLYPSQIYPKLRGCGTNRRFSWSRETPPKISTPKIRKKSVPSRLYAVNSNQGRHPEAKTIFARACDEGRTEANENLEKSQIAVSKKNFLR